MARSIEEIQKIMLEAKENEPALNVLSESVPGKNWFEKVYNYMFGNERSTSKVAIWRLWIYIVAYCIHTLELLFDFHRNFIENKLLKYRHGRLSWYHRKALEFQYGFNLIKDTDAFDNRGKTEKDIELSKIIKYCAVNESDGNGLIIKIATEKEGVLSPLTDSQLQSFRNYMDEIKYGGVKITIINLPPDLLRLNLKILRNPLVLDENGMNILTGSYPVNDTIKKFLQELPFNGEFSIQRLEEKILALEGVNDLALDLCETAYIDGTASAGYGGYEPISIIKIPFSGYFKVNLDTKNEHKSTITYV